MGLLDKWKDLLGLNTKKEEKKQTENSSNIVINRTHTVNKTLPPATHAHKAIVNIDNRSDNRKQHRRLLLEEAENGSN